MTVAGSVALELFEVRVIVIPPLGAGPFKVTVPTEAFPPTTVDGFTDTVTSVGGFTVIVAF